MEKKVLLKDIAQKVGSSIALVSYVLNGKDGRVGAAMAAEIRRTAEELGYRPNLVAKSLQSGRTHTLGLIVADISNSFFSRVARIIEDEAKQFGYTVIFGSTDEDAEKSRLLTDAFLNRQVDGLIIAPAASTEEQLQVLKKRKFPFVLIDRYFPSLPVNSIRTNNYESAYEAAEHLAGTGHQRIALITYQHAGMAHFSEREKGYLQAVKDCHLPEYLAKIPYRGMEDAMVACMNELLVTGSNTDALLFATHSLAIEGLKQINRLGIKVPDQLAVVSFDENDAFDLYGSPVSYIRQPLALIGKEAVRLLVETIREPGMKQTQIVLENELVIRKSSGRVVPQK
jgi:LacI family transcriptional regulator